MWKLTMSIPRSASRARLLEEVAARGEVSIRYLDTLNNDGLRWLIEQLETPAPTIDDGRSLWEQLGGETRNDGPSTDGCGQGDEENLQTG
jgi:hypothetical protein